MKLEITNLTDDSAVGIGVDEKELLLMVKQLNIIYGITSVKIMVNTTKKLKLTSDC